MGKTTTYKIKGLDRIMTKKNFKDLQGLLDDEDLEVTGISIENNGKDLNIYFESTW